MLDFFSLEYECGAVVQSSVEFLANKFIFLTLAALTRPPPVLERVSSVELGHIQNGGGEGS